jgi:glutamate decarboxylase
MHENATDVAVLRIVVREGFSADLGRLLCEAFADSLAALRKGEGGHSSAQAFAH